MYGDDCKTQTWLFFWTFYSVEILTIGPNWLFLNGPWFRFSLVQNTCSQGCICCVDACEQLLVLSVLAGGPVCETGRLGFIQRQNSRGSQVWPGPGAFEGFVDSVPSSSDKKPADPVIVTAAALVFVLWVEDFRSDIVVSRSWSRYGLEAAQSAVELRCIKDK